MHILITLRHHHEVQSLFFAKTKPPVITPLTPLSQQRDREHLVSRKYGSSSPLLEKTSSPWSAQRPAAELARPIHDLTRDGSRAMAARGVRGVQSPLHRLLALVVDDPSPCAI